MEYQLDNKVCRNFSRFGKNEIKVLFTTEEYG